MAEGVFVRGAGLLSAGLALGSGAGKAGEQKALYKAKWYEFTNHPESDTCWSLSVGPDGRIYAAACAEGAPGGVVKLVRYNEQKVADLGVAASVIERRRYGYVFGDAVTGRDGEILFGEDDDFGHLWLYFPKIVGQA